MSSLCELCGEMIADGHSSCPSCGASVGAAVGSVALAPGYLLAGRFVIRGVLGEGGFGVTYRAFDQMLDHDVAVKELMPPGAHRNASGSVVARTNAPLGPAVERFIREARALRLMHHDGIVWVFDFFEANNTGYLVMELLEGDTLESVLRTDGRWSEDRVRAFLASLSGALSAVHAQGLLHRDLKPANVMMVPGRGPVLIDFGSVRQTSADESSALTAVVSHGYAPLEQYATSGRIGPTADVYSLGSVLFEVLVGHPPAPANMRALSDDVMPLLRLRPDVTRGLCEAIDSALRIRPAERPQTIEDFLARIDPVERPFVAEPRPGTLPVTRPPARRRSTLVVAAVVVAAAAGITALLLPKTSSDVAGEPTVAETSAAVTVADTSAAVTTVLGATATVVVSLPTGMAEKPQFNVGTGSPPKNLVIKDLVVGTGSEVKAGSNVVVNYVGKAWSTGEEFDSSWSRNQTFELTNVGQAPIIQGWNDGLIGMKQGGRRELTIPADLAYGAVGQGPIKGGETLVFVIDAVTVSSPTNSTVTATTATRNAGFGTSTTRSLPAPHSPPPS